MSEMSVMQSTVFCYFLIYGIVTGFWYDFLKTLRVLIRHKYLWVQMEDVLFTLTTASGLFALIHRYNHGSVRLYILLGTALGIIVYCFLLHPLTGRILKIVLMTVLNVFGVLFHRICRPAKKIIKYIDKILKNTFRTVRMVRNRL